MPARRSSPPLSETEVDIGASLFGPDDHSQQGSYESDDAAQAKEKLLGTSELGVLDDEAFIAQQQAASNRKSSNLKGRTVKKGGGFQTMGLSGNLLKAITRKGFSVPTPIQRKTIPLLLNGKDVVGMARTGSGKTAAFLIPLIEKLRAHSTQVGARALVMSPSRELALQTLQVCRELAKGTDLKTILLVGGDSLEEQFASMSSNPDVVIATPGRFVHLKVEMGLDLSSIRYCVFDEADRLFEMGFADQLTEILNSLPPSRQTLLFSATLPKSLVEFARAGLQDPILVRLDTESKVSPDLQSAFFTVRSSEKEGALLHVLEDVIHVPTSSQLETSSENKEQNSSHGKKRKRGQTDNQANIEVSNPYSTIVFAATKHHVEYLARLLSKAGYSVSHVYGTLDQTARKMHVQAFRTGRTNILVVTDVAARGIDIPVLANVINYDFPSQPKIFLHRVGRTARAGQKGWSYSIVHDADAPYLLDLQLFLSRKLVVGRDESGNVNFATDVVVGGLQRDQMQTSCEWVSRTLEEDVDIYALRSVATKGEKLYQRTRTSASAESAKRAKAVVASSHWSELNPLFNSEANNLEAERERMLARIGGFRPEESIFEIGARRGGRKNTEEAVDAIRKIRTGLDVKREKTRLRNVFDPKTSIAHVNGSEDQPNGVESEKDEVMIENPEALDMSEASDSEIEVTFSNHQHSKDGNANDRHNKSEAQDPTMSFRDSENFMSYTPVNTNLSEDRAYAVHSGPNVDRANFTEAARDATMDLGGDETGGKAFGQTRQVMRWDKRHKKYVRRSNDEDGSKGGNRLVRSESGAKIAASFKSGRYDAWRKANRIRHVPRVGEAESATTSQQQNGPLGRKFKHNKMQTAKAPDKFRDDYAKKSKKFREAKEKAREMGEYDAGKTGGKITNTVDDIRKQRNLKQKRREKNARPSRKSKR